MPSTPKPLLLLVLDGWGYSDNPEHNAIFSANKPTWDYLWAHYPHTLIRASEAAVGLPTRQMGNSEVGHLNLGAGRVVYQEYTRINRAIRSTGMGQLPGCTLVRWSLRDLHRECEQHLGSLQLYFC